MSNITDFYKSFSGSDCVCYLKFEDHKPFVFGTLTTISYSLDRRVKPVSLLGRNKVGGFSKSQRLVAGTMIATLINQHLVNDLKEHMTYLQNYDRILLDELPIFDILIIAANEYGAISHMVIKHATFASEGKVISIQDLLTETQISYFARDVEPFQSSTYKYAGSIEADFYAPVVSNIISFIDTDDNENHYIFLTDYLDANGITWWWDNSTKTVHVVTKNGKEISWKPADYNTAAKANKLPLPGVYLNNVLDKHIITDENALFQFLNNSTGESNDGYIFLTTWLEAHGHSWEWNSTLGMAVFYLSDGRIFYTQSNHELYMPGTKYYAPAQKHIVVDEAALYKFCNTPVTISGVNYVKAWAIRNGHDWYVDANKNLGIIFYTYAPYYRRGLSTVKRTSPGVELNTAVGELVIKDEEKFLAWIESQKQSMDNMYQTQYDKIVATALAASENAYVGKPSNGDWSQVEELSSSSVTSTDAIVLYDPTYNWSEVSVSFKNKVKLMADRLGVNFNHLMAIMYAESNFGRTSTLLSFTTASESVIGTSVSTVKALPPEEQLPYVEAYFKYWLGKGLLGNTLINLYTIVLWPAANGKADGYVLYKEGDYGWEGNKGLDLNKDNKVTVYDVRKWIEGKLSSHID